MSLTPIKKWTPKQEMVVHLHCSRMPSIKIAEVMELTTTRVSQILCDPQARAIVRAVTARMRAKMEQDIEGGLFKMAELAVERLGETMDTEFVAGSDAKKHQDRISIDLVKGLGFLPGSESRKDLDRPPLDEKLAKRLVGALEKSNTAEAERVKKDSEGEILVEPAVVIETEVLHD